RDQAGDRGAHGRALRRGAGALPRVHARRRAPGRGRGGARGGCAESATPRPERARALLPGGRTRERRVPAGGVVRRLIPRDGVPENTHPLNLVEAAAGEVLPVERPPLYEVYMRMAEELAKRSSCARLRVGTVITDP